MVKAAIVVFILMFTTCCRASNDPTRPLSWPTVGTMTGEPMSRVKPSLKSIICMTTCAAVINNRVMSIGDKIDGYTITEIDDSFVLMTRNEQEWKLELYSLDIKQ